MNLNRIFFNCVSNCGSRAFGKKQLWPANGRIVLVEINEIFDFVTKHRSAKPRTAYRYALERMPKDMRAEAMKK